MMPLFFNSGKENRDAGPNRFRNPAVIAGIVLFMGGAAPGVWAQSNLERQEIVLTLDEAIQIAVVQNLNLQSQRLELDNAQALIKEGWAELYPQLDLASSYIRNVESPDPFAGSQASGFFQTLGFIDWLAYNEQSRTDTDPSSTPISFPEFFQRRQAGLDEAGIVLESSDNPFSVPSVYRNGLSISQKLFDGRVIFGAAGAARWLGPFTQSAIDRREQLLVASVEAGFFRSLLAAEQVNVARQSVSRAQSTLQELARQVEAGTAPKFQRLSAEVELANLQTQLIQAENLATESLDDLKLLLGIPVEQPLRLRGSLEASLASDFSTGSIDHAAATALQNRPDLKQSHINIELERIQLKVTRSEYLPDLSAFLNLNYVGNVPDNRRVVTTDPSDPFTFSSSENGYFSSDYWNWDMNVGLSLTWNLFNGFASKQRIQQRKIAVQQATLNHEYLTNSVRVEVEASIRDINAARSRLNAQGRNVERAELNYTFVETRLREGVASPIELREASDQLDQSRLNYLQAVHDLLIARSTFRTAIGTSSDL